MIYDDICLILEGFLVASRCHIFTHDGEVHFIVLATCYALLTGQVRALIFILISS
jgi:hypothetical protein